LSPSQNGTARKLIVKTQYRLPATGEAAEESKATAMELAALAGDYWSNELRATYRLAIKDGKLWMKELVGAGCFRHQVLLGGQRVTGRRCFRNLLLVLALNSF
jgi:hypothetical protein